MKIDCVLTLLYLFHIFNFYKIIFFVMNLKQNTLLYQSVEEKLYWG